MRPVDFYILDSQGKKARKSDMHPDTWKLYYPVDRVMINQFNYNLTSSDIVNIMVPWEKSEISVRTKPNWGAYRMFLHHVGQAAFGQGEGKKIGTVFGVIYLDRGVIHRLFFGADGRWRMEKERFTHVGSLVSLQRQS